MIQSTATTRTLADLKRALTPETRLTCLYNAYTPKFVAITRYIATADTTGIYLKEEKDRGTLQRGVFLEWPKASRLIYQTDTTDGDVFSIYTQDKCELTYRIEKSN